MSTNQYDGKWGREIREQLQRERAATRLSATRLQELHGIAAMAQKIIPGPWAFTKRDLSPAISLTTILKQAEQWPNTSPHSTL